VIVQNKVCQIFSALLASLCFVTSSLAADAVPENKQQLTTQQEDTAFPIPDRYSLVNDYFGVLMISKAVEITKKLQALERRNGTQIVFLSVPSVGAEGIRAYAIRVAIKWDIGNNGQGNGVLFLVSQKDGGYILTGPGIQGAIPDVLVGRIFRETIGPLWQREQYSEGIEAAIDRMIKAALGEETDATFYDYANAIVPVRTETRIIALLVLLGAAYASVLLWVRYKKRKRAAL